MLIWGSILTLVDETHIYLSEHYCISHTLYLLVAVRPRPVASLPSSCGKKQTPERIEYVTESEMEESEFETAQHNRTASLYGSSTSEDDSSSEDDV